MALKGETPGGGKTLFDLQSNQNPVQLEWGAEGEFWERCPCVAHSESSISTQLNESFMDLNYKGTKSNTFFNTKSPHPTHDITAGICGTDCCGVWSFSVLKKNVPTK